MLTRYSNHFPTISHISNNCLEALKQDRYTWKHDHALEAAVTGLKRLLILVITFMQMYLLTVPMKYSASRSPLSTVPEDILDTFARHCGD